MTTSFDVAHIRTQGVDLIIVPLEPSFGYKPSSEQASLIDSLQIAARSAGLAGTVVPVWRSGGRHSFIAPRNWHPFFKSLSWSAIAANLNKRLRIH